MSSSPDRGGGPAGSVLRVSVRALLVDEQGRVLLLRSEEPDTGLPFWYPPGGGVEDGEEPVAALSRELLEEVGLAGLEIGPEVWTRRHAFSWRGVTYDQWERWFLCRVHHFGPSGQGRTETEVEDLTAARWWGLPELAATTDRLTPRDLANRLDQLLREGPPQSPIAVDA